MGSTFLSSFLPSLYPSLFSVAYVTVIDGSRLLLLLLLHTRQMDEGNVSLHSGALYTCLGFFVSICGSENIRYLHSPYEASSFFTRRYFYYVKNLTLRGEIRIFPVESIDIFTRSARARKTFPVSFFIFNFFFIICSPPHKIQYLFNNSNGCCAVCSVNSIEYKKEKYYKYPRPRVHHRTCIILTRQQTQFKD